ncbi:MAG: Gfo/Idh/MocA family oxidoreductase [Verrucomicrobia bacterium]|nr:Gfo/Idh/MocA family oxidoreductase [Verrucomicrobiota bacterium]
MNTKIGVVGLGFMGVTHIRSWLNINGAELAAICDPINLPEDGDFSQISGNFGPAEPLKLDMTNITPYADFNDLVKNPEIDLIDICAPTHLHERLTIAALEAGKHVVCEKPMARRSSEARTMAGAAGKSGKFLMPAMCMRFWPEWAWLKEQVRNKSFGKALAARFRRVSEPPAWGKGNYFDGSKSGGALFDLHIHDTDFVQFCFGKPSQVCSHGLSRYSDAVDHVVTQYRFENGPVVYTEGTWLMSEGGGFNMGFTVHFENATADFDLQRGDEALKLFAKGKEVETISCEGDNAHTEELKHMIDSIQNNRPPSIVTPQDGVSSVEICEAEEESVRSGKPVDLATNSSKS